MKQSDHWSWDVFVSHNRQQKPWVRSLVSQCRRRGLRVFFDEDDIEPGEDIVTGIERGLQGSKCIVVIISPDAMSSRWVALETAISVYLDSDGTERKVIPVLLENTPLNTIRLAIQRLNMVNLTESHTRRAQYCKLFKFFGVVPAPPIPRMRASVRPSQRAHGYSNQEQQAKDKNPSLSPPVEVEEVIAFRCKHAKINNPFPSDSARQIYDLSGGIPREVLRICTVAYEMAQIAKMPDVHPDIIDSAFRELQLRDGASDE